MSESKQNSIEEHEESKVPSANQNKITDNNNPLPAFNGEADKEGSRDTKKKVKLLKNRESASKSRKKKKAMFESLRVELSIITRDKNSIKQQMKKYKHLLDKTITENTTIRSNIKELADENKRLKDTIHQMQQSLNQTRQSIFGAILQSRSQAMSSINPFFGINNFNLK